MTSTLHSAEIARHSTGDEGDKGAQPRKGRGERGSADDRDIHRESFGGRPPTGGSGHHSPASQPDLVFDRKATLQPGSKLVEIQIDIDAWAQCLKSFPPPLPNHSWHMVTSNPIQFRFGDGVVSADLSISFMPQTFVHTTLEVQGIYLEYNLESIKHLNKWMEGKLKDACLEQNLLWTIPTIYTDGSKAHHRISTPTDPSDLGYYKGVVEQSRQIASIQIELFLRALGQNEGTFEFRVPAPKRPQIASGQGQNHSEALDITSMEVVGEHHRLSDVGGNPDLKRELSGLVNQFNNREHFEKYGVSLPRGILLFGPPGTGKTLAAKALAGELGRKFYQVQGHDLLSVWFSESEKRIAQLFDNVETPCVLFVDEIDAIGEKRSMASEPVRRTLSTLLQKLDGMGSREDILLVGATNRKDELDEALLRAGRFSKHIFVGPPNKDGLEQIWGIHLNKISEAAQQDILSADLDVGEISKESAGLVGADVKEIVHRGLNHIAQASLVNNAQIQITQTLILEEIAAYRRERAEINKANSFGFTAIRDTQEKIQ